MKALTVWQPWATLIIAGAKPFEFRRWDYRTRDRGLEGQRIVIHAGARPIKRAERPPATAKGSPRMKMTLESTTKIVELRSRNGAVMQARIWEGVTENGVPVHAFITRVACHKELDNSELVRDLREHKPATPEVERAYDLRLFID